jgi:maleate isomerase
LSAPEYASAGLVGLLTPQANTTAEAELGVLLEPGTGLAVSRLTCYDEDSRARLLGYFANASAALRAFDTARPGVTLFACTGSSYLVGLQEEQDIFLQLGVISAAQAVLAALDALGAKRLALVSPYPAWLTEACVAFWQAQGRTVAEVRSPAGNRDDTRRIYALQSSDALAEIERLKDAKVDCILVSGTGMPSLGAIARARTGRPVLSSNLCLGWAAMQRLAGAPCDRASLERWLAPGAAWRGRLAARFPFTIARP